MKMDTSPYVGLGFYRRLDGREPQEQQDQQQQRQEQNAMVSGFDPRRSSSLYNKNNFINSNSNSHGSRARDNNTSTTNQTALDVYMDEYLQQCLQYHEEQEALRQQQQRIPQQTEQPQIEPLTTILNKPSHQTDLSKELVSFVSGGIFLSEYMRDSSKVDSDLSSPAVFVVNQNDPEENGKQSQNEYRMDCNGPTVALSTTIESKPETQSPSTNILHQSLTDQSVLLDDAAAQGRRRAQDILLKFQRQQEQLLYQQQQQTIPGTSFTLDKHLWSDESPDPSLFLEQRRRGFQREMRIKKRANLENLEYIAEKERLRSQRLQEQIDRAKTREELANAEYDAAAKWRHEQQTLDRPLATFAGIGTRKRKQVERIRKRMTSDTAAIYVAGLPTTSNATPTTELLQELFGSFGTIEKIHLYQDKTTGIFKGDGLIVYHLPKKEHDHPSAESFVQMICLQMNGAILPGGVQLTVEPSSSNHGDPPTRPEPDIVDMPSSSIVTPLSTLPKPLTIQPENSKETSANIQNLKQPESPETATKGDDHDLDDFFDSLL